MKKNIIKGHFPNGEKQYYDFSEVLRNKQRNIIEIIFENNADLFDLAMIKYWFDDHALCLPMHVKSTDFVF